MPEFIESHQMEREMIRTLKRRQKGIVLIMLIGILVIVVIYAFHVIFWHKLI